MEYHAAGDHQRLSGKFNYSRELKHLFELGLDPYHNYYTSEGSNRWNQNSFGYWHRSRPTSVFYFQ